VVGLLIGVVAAAATTQLFRAVLFGVSPYDSVTFIGAPLVMLAIAVAAAFVPTRRVMQVDPISVLRSE
jgi:ABC-type antimicrobial peptide transport system permease subunit